MRLDHLCDMELVYRQELYGKFVLLRPYGTEEGAGYGEGDGTISGERLRGTARWVNHPRRRSDAAMLPDVHGVIRTDDGAHILFSFQGRTKWVGSAPDRRGSQVFMVLFEAADERYRWLNDALCVLEGVIDPKSLTMRSLIYMCVNEIV